MCAEIVKKEYEAERCGTKEENERQRLDAVLKKPHDVLRGAGWIRFVD